MVDARFNDYLEASTEPNADSIIVHDELEMAGGYTYIGTFELGNDTDQVDIGVVVSDSGDSFSNYNGYLFFFHTQGDEIQIRRQVSGSSQNQTSANLTYEANTRYIFEIDYRDSDIGEITLRVYKDDYGGSPEAVATLNDTAYDHGKAGFYRFFSGADWRIGSLQDEESFHTATFHADIPMGPSTVSARGRPFDVSALEVGESTVPIPRARSHASGGAFEATGSTDISAELSPATAAASGGEFDITSHDHPMIVVGEGETFTKRFDADETWGDVGIDVSAPGAAYDIFCDKGGVTIENVGIYGHVEDDSDSRFRVEVTENVSEPTVVRNVYLPGVGARSHNKAGPKVFSHPDHEGHVSFEGVTIKNHPDGGLRLAGSGIADPEHPNDPGGGTYTVENCYVTGCGLANVSIASDGTSVEHSFIADAHSSAGGLWAPHGDASTVTVDDTVLVGNPTDIRVGGGQWATADDDITVAASNSRWVTDTTHASGTLVGSPVGETFYLEPNDVGAPNSPEQAAKNETPVADPPATSGITLETLEPSTVGYVSATLVGEIEGHHESAEVGFEWKSEMETPTEEFVGDGTFDQHVSGLEPGETYTVRATAATDGGAYIRGGWVTFETHESPGSVRERFDDGLDAYEGDTDGFEIVGDE